MAEIEWHMVGSQVALKVKFSILGILRYGICDSTDVHMIRMSEMVANDILFTCIHCRCTFSIHFDQKHLCTCIFMQLSNQTIMWQQHDAISHVVAVLHVKSLC